MTKLHRNREKGLVRDDREQSRVLLLIKDLLLLLMMKEVVMQWMIAAMLVPAHVTISLGDRALYAHNRFCCLKWEVRQKNLQEKGKENFYSLINLMIFFKVG